MPALDENTADLSGEKLDAEYVRCVDEWKEELRWTQFLNSFLLKSRLLRPVWDSLPSDTYMPIMEESAILQLTTTTPWLGAASDRFQGLSQDEIKRAFVLDWRKRRGPLRDRRHTLVVQVMEKLLADPDTAEAYKHLESAWPHKIKLEW